MTYERDVATSRPQRDEGLITEVVRRLMLKPRYAAADPNMLRELVKAAMDDGITTIFGLVRAIDRDR